MNKDSLVIIPGFSTNSQMFKDLIEYLEQFFVVYCIDIPGFCKEKEPLSQHTIDSFTTYIKHEIERLELKEYYLAGISFGYFLANQVCDPNYCRGIIAIYPFLSAKHLKMNTVKLTLLRTGVESVSKLKLSQKIWRSTFFPTLLQLSGMSKEEISLLFQHIDATTFFTTASFILNCKQPITPPDIPHVIIVNDDDELIRTSDMIESFMKLEQKLLLKSSISHLPIGLNKQMIQQSFPPNLIYQAKQFLFSH